MSTILIIGGTGSIGRTVLKVLMAPRAHTIRVFSRDENAQHELRQELEAADTARAGDVRWLLGDIRDRNRLMLALRGVETVYNFAAVKHVAAAEYNPGEAVAVNIIGTQNVIECCAERGVKTLVHMSTDKAVNPVSLMGATKLVAERLCFDYARWLTGLKIVVVRSGNVLGSRGSIVPTVRYALEHGGMVRLVGDATRFVIMPDDLAGFIVGATKADSSGELWIPPMLCVRVRDLFGALCDEWKQDCAVSPAFEWETVKPSVCEKLHEELSLPSEAHWLSHRQSRVSGDGPFLSVSEIVGLLQRYDE